MRLIATQVLQRLADGGGGSVMRQDTPQMGESPIYYLQLPPSPYYYADDSDSASVPLPSHHKASSGKSRSETKSDPYRECFVHSLREQRYVRFFLFHCCSFDVSFTVGKDIIMTHTDNLTNHNNKKSEIFQLLITIKL